MKITCNVIKDLLPLYYDKICSEDTRKIVEEHLENCENCRKELSYMSDDYTYDAHLNEEKIRENASKSVNKVKRFHTLLGFITSICLIGLIFIIVNLISIYSKDRFTSLEDYEYKYTFETGFYEVGVHIPAGTYVVQVEDIDKGYFYLYDMDDRYIYYKGEYSVTDNKKDEKDILKQHFDAYYFFLQKEKQFKNITLKEGQLLYIEPKTNLVFYSNEIETTSLKPIEITHTGTYSVDIGIAGEDFPAGVYDIIYKPKDTDQSGEIKCNIYDIDTNQWFRTYKFECDGKEGEQVVFRGMPLTPDSEITVENVDEIILVPSQYIGKTFNSITWEANP